MIELICLHFLEEGKTSEREQQEKKYKLSQLFEDMKAGKVIEKQLMKKDFNPRSSWLNKIINVFYKKTDTGEWERIIGWYKCSKCEDFYRFISQNADGNWELKNHVRSKHRSVYDNKEELKYEFEQPNQEFLIARKTLVKFAHSLLKIGANSGTVTKKALRKIIPKTAEKLIDIPETLEKIKRCAENIELPVTEINEFIESVSTSYRIQANNGE